MDYKARDKFFRDSGVKIPKQYDVIRFEELDAKQLEHCVEQGWADPRESQNYAPNTQEILEFIKANPDLKAHGYVVSPRRLDTRITLEGVSGKTTDKRQLQAFIDMFKGADEFEVDLETGECRAWFD